MDIENFNVRLTPLSPIHIGTGDVYEPINYVIEKFDDKKGYLYAFDEFVFFENLPQKDKTELIGLLNENSILALLKIQKFFKDRRQIAKNIAYKKVVVSSEIVDDYEKKIGHFVHKGKEEINQMLIEKTYILPNSNKAIILGSSLKGAILTALGKNSLSNLIISDSQSQNSDTFIDEAKNIKRKHEEDNEGIEVKMEAISAKSIFETTFGLKDDLQISDIIKLCNEHYLPIFKSQFSYETDENTRAHFSNEFIQEYEDFTPGKNQFLVRIGKHSGARAVTFDDKRKIWNAKAKKEMSEESTTWVINKQPLGWLLCEINEV